MDKLSDLIQKRLNQHKIGDSALASEIVFKANQYISIWLKCEVDEVRAYKFQNGILHINVFNSVWSQEAWGISEKLLSKLKSDFSENFVKKIVIKCLTL